MLLLLLYMKQYVSPFSILGIDASQSADKQSVTLAKKKLLAEIELSSSQTIFISGKEMTKNDLLNLFDGLEKSEEAKFHKMIADVPELLAFLEQKQGFILSDFSKKLSANYYELNFVSFVSPYFSSAYYCFLLKNIAAQNLENVKLLSNNFPLLMNYADKNQASLFIQNIFQNNLLLINNLKLKSYLHQKEAFDDFDFKQNNFLIDCLNVLKFEEIEEFRTNYGRKLFNFFVNLWNIKEYYYFADEILKMVERLDVDESLSSHIQKTKETIISQKNNQDLISKDKSHLFANFGVKFTIDSFIGRFFNLYILIVIVNNYFVAQSDNSDFLYKTGNYLAYIAFGFCFIGALFGMSNVIDLYRILRKIPIPKPNKEWILRINDFIILVASFFLIGKILKISAIITVILCVYSSVMALFLFLPWVILNGKLDMKAGYFLNQFQNTNIKTVVGKMTLNLILSVWLLHLLQNPIFLILVKNGIK